MLPKGKKAGYIRDLYSEAVIGFLPELLGVISEETSEGTTAIQEES